jgi:hypothetical protein
MAFDRFPFCNSSSKLKAIDILSEDGEQLVLRLEQIEERMDRAVLGYGLDDGSAGVDSRCEFRYDGLNIFPELLWHGEEGVRLKQRLRILEISLVSHLVVQAYKGQCRDNGRADEPCLWQSGSLGCLHMSKYPPQLQRRCSQH